MQEGVIASFQDLKNFALWRLRQRGVSFNMPPGNSATDVVPPYALAALLNQGYSEFLSATIEAYIVTLKTTFLTTLNATAYSIRPLPNTPLGALNPAALRVLEMTYTTAPGGTNGGYEFGVELVSTARFSALSGDYTRRLSWFGPRVLYAARLFRRPQIDVLPGTATVGDTLAVTIVPDPANSPGVPCASGGPMVNDADVPLIPNEFQMALVEYVVMNAGDTTDQAVKTKTAEDRWNAYILKALTEGGTEDGGDPMRVVDTWGPRLYSRDGM